MAESRVETMIPVAGGGNLASVTVVMLGPPSMTDIEQAGAFAKLAAMSVRRAYSVAACPGHEWAHEFPAAYLGDELDALCRCGARRSEVARVENARALLGPGPGRDHG